MVSTLSYSLAGWKRFMCCNPATISRLSWALIDLPWICTSQALMLLSRVIFLTAWATYKELNATITLSSNPLSIKENPEQITIELSPLQFYFILFVKMRWLNFHVFWSLGGQENTVNCFISDDRLSLDARKKKISLFGLQLAWALGF